MGFHRSLTDTVVQQVFQEFTNMIRLHEKIAKLCYNNAFVHNTDIN